MPQVPILIPLIVAGAFLGSVWSSKDLMAVWKKAILAASVSGILNAVYAWSLGALKIVALTNNNLVFLASCGVVSFLVVVAVYLSALGMMRYRRGRALEPEE